MSELSPISLVIPTYNRGDLVRETIDSALAQTHPFSEIIVVDDGSTDHTEQVLKQYGRRITVIRTENGGVQSARNRGVSSSNTPLVALCDSDDVLEPSFCGTLVPWLSSHPNIDICYSNFVNFDESRIFPDKFSQAPDGFFEGGRETDNVFLVELHDLYRRLLVFQPLFPTGMVITKRLFETIGGYDPRFRGVGSEDWEFTLRAVESGNVALCKTPLSRIRRHSGNDSASSTHMNLGEAEVLEFALKNHISAKKYQNEILDSIDRRRVMAFDSVFAKGDFLRSKEILARIRKFPKNMKFFLKWMLLYLPSGLQKNAWRISQRIHKENVHEMPLDFICLNNDGFDGLTRPRHIIARLLSRQPGYRVFYVSPAPRSAWQRIKKNCLRLGGVKKYSETLYWIMPLTFFRKFYNRKAQLLSSYFWVLSIRLYFFIYKVKNPVFFVTTPDFEFISLLRRFRQSPIIYNVHDRYLDSSNHWIPEHFSLLNISDAVLCTSTFLLEEHKSFVSEDKIHYFPPGVNFEIFANKVDADNELNQEPARRNITIGCVGSFGTQIDWELLNYISDKSDYKFLFVGIIVNSIKEDEQFNIFKSRRSVDFIGKMDHEEIPSVMSRFDLCILPYKRSEFSKGINPLKLLEYFAMGKPVVSAPIPSIAMDEELCGLVSIAETGDDWLKSLEAEFSENNHCKIRQRISYAKRYDYPERVSCLASIVKNLYRMKYQEF
ncbi:MAG: glycosyltransferase [Candidatus Accumulibacter sp.]|jgi:glycosyltransferase involved in cell wall biosynthesis|nr:glycosyltransferase [Accumulibacter sp.]